MRCETNREAIVLMIHDELEEGRRLDLDMHLKACPDCASALEEERRLLGLVDGALGDAPSPALLSRCREDLRRALAGEPGAVPARWLAALRRSVRPRLSPAWATALLACGFMVGRVMPGAGSPATGARQEAGVEEGGTIANVDFHDTDPLSDRIHVSYDTLQRTSLSGTAGDPRIRRVLVDTVRDSRNPGLRLEAMDVLRRHVDDREVRAALVRAVRDDDNAGARLKALEALKGRVADDAEVRGAVVDALVKDPNPGVRVRAIDALQGARGPETLAVLRRLADQDSSEYVRMRSAAMVSEMMPLGGTR